TYVSKFTNMRFDPAGMTDDADVRLAQSVMDYIFRRLALDHLPYEKRAGLGIFTADERIAQTAAASGTSLAEPAVIAEDDEVDLDSLRSSAPVEKPIAKADLASEVAAKPAPRGVGSSAELLEAVTGKSNDAPLCMTCGVKMRPAGSCYVCEGCGSTSGCS
ncbi:MAG: vitamin B12-dependent ribonucleotide reductase, partial [Actinomycetota bacterium]|nr:vitamin B12-dependent ribonucleotide reductase [Actinomycetota bacterium]